VAVLRQGHAAAKPPQPGAPAASQSLRLRQVAASLPACTNPCCEDVSVSTGCKGDPWSAAATAAGDETGEFLFVNVTDAEFLTGFVRKRTLAEELLKCQRAVDEIIAGEGRKSKEKKADPFNAPSGSAQRVIRSASNPRLE